MSEIVKRGYQLRQKPHDGNSLVVGTWLFRNGSSSGKHRSTVEGDTTVHVPLDLHVRRLPCQVRNGGSWTFCDLKVKEVVTRSPGDGLTVIHWRDTKNLYFNSVEFTVLKWAECKNSDDLASTPKVKHTLLLFTLHRRIQFHNPQSRLSRYYIWRPEK